MKDRYVTADITISIDINTINLFFISFCVEYISTMEQEMDKALKEICCSLGEMGKRYPEFIGSFSQCSATRNEIMEACFVATLMGGGPSLMYTQLVMKAIDDYTRK